MKESYREGVASHPGPQPCEGGCEAALGAWERGIRRQGIELRKQLNPGADAVRADGRPHGGGRQRESAPGPAESQTPGMRRNFLRENRETPWSSVHNSERTGGRTRKAASPSRTARGSRTAA